LGNQGVLYVPNHVKMVKTYQFAFNGYIKYRKTNLTWTFFQSYTHAISMEKNNQCYLHDAGAI
jgi:hypothetical protein